MKLVGAVGQWNLLWESAQFRRRFFDEGDLPEPLGAIADLGDVNVSYVPRTRSRYFEYAPLLHLFPKRVLDMFGLPVMRRGQWPFMADYAGIDDFLPSDFAVRLGRAWACLVWPHLVSGSKIKAFSPDDPIRLLAHNRAQGVPFSFVRVDRARNMSKRQSATGFHFSRTGGTCPLWNVYEAFGTPGRLITQVARMPDGSEHFWLARTVTRRPGGWGRPTATFAVGLGCELRHASRLVYSDGLDLGPGRAVVPIGMGLQGVRTPVLPPTSLPRRRPATARR